MYPPPPPSFLHLLSFFPLLSFLPYTSICQFLLCTRGGGGGRGSSSSRTRKIGEERGPVLLQFLLRWICTCGNVGLQDLQCNPYKQVCLEGVEANCAFPCPSLLFTNAEVQWLLTSIQNNSCNNQLPYQLRCFQMHPAPPKYQSQYLSYVVPGGAALVLNAWMVVGLLVMGKKARQKLPKEVVILFPVRSQKQYSYYPTQASK